MKNLSDSNTTSDYLNRKVSVFAWDEDGGPASLSATIIKVDSNTVTLSYDLKDYQYNQHLTNPVTVPTTKIVNTFNSKSLSINLLD